MIMVLLFSRLIPTLGLGGGCLFNHGHALASWYVWFLACLAGGLLLGYKYLVITKSHHAQQTNSSSEVPETASRTIRIDG